MKQQKVALIFGISGQDGGYLAQFLINKGYSVHGTSRDAEINSFQSLKLLRIQEKVTLHSAILTDFRSILQIIEKVEPHEIYNLSGQSSVGLSFEQPIETTESISIATLNVLEVLRFLKIDSRFYNASSSECFGDTHGHLANEKTPFYPKSPYAIAKAAAHWEVVNYRESYGMHVCSGILFNHESPLRPSRFVTRKIISAAVRIAMGSREHLVLGDLSIKRDWGWAPEYVEAMWLMLQRSEPSDYVIATGRAYSLEDFVINAFTEVGLNWENYVDYNSNLCRPSEIQFSCGDATKAHIDLGWQANIYLPEVISRMIKVEKTLRMKPMK
jgi:GDPmannose 4,6-dehydratase